MTFFVIGTMSGTSCDGIDAAAVTTDGVNQLVAHSQWRAYSRYSLSQRQVLLQAMGAHKHDNPKVAEALVKEAEEIVTREHIRCLKQLLQRMKEQGCEGLQDAVIGFHGQTILHQPHRGVTQQIGNGQAIANALGLRVVGDFRTKDVKSGGQGAPLAPIGHWLFSKMSKLFKSSEGSLGVLNIGGVSNITIIPADGLPEHLHACDVGPGGAIMDDFMLKKLGLPYDQNGELAQKGEIVGEALEALKKDPFFSKMGPKSLDRNHFTQQCHALLDEKPIEDALRTLVALSSWSVASYLRQLPEVLRPNVLIVAGGGACNRLMLQEITDAVAPVQVIRANNLQGWDQDFLEAQIFGILAARVLQQLPTSFPGTTGVPRPLCGGTIWEPQVS